MNSFDIDDLITKLNQYLLPLYPLKVNEQVVMQADYDNDRLTEPYAEVQRGIEDQASYLRTRRSYELDGDNININFSASDDYELDFQTYGNVQDSKLLSNQIRDWFRFVAEQDETITVREISSVTPSSIEVAQETIKTFLFTVTLAVETTTSITEGRVEGVEFNVNKI